MVLSHRVYSTSHNPRQQVCVPRSQKDYLEQHLLKKRNAERDRLEYWSGTCKYYDKVEKQNVKFNNLVSDESRRTSLDAFQKKRDVDKQRLGLEERREKLRNLLQSEAEEWEAEMKLLPKESQDIKDLRLVREMFRKEKEEEQRKENELKMLQHWKINNPQIRQVESARNERLAQKYLEQQIQERRDAEEATRRQQELERLEREKKARQEEEAAARREEERRLRLEEWRRELDHQLQDLRQRETQAQHLQQQAHNQQQVLTQANLMKQQTERAEKMQHIREIKSYQKNQHSLLLKKKSEAVETELEEDRARIGKMLRLVEAQDDWERREKDKAIKEVKWMQQVLEHQRSEEQRRRQEMELLFAEEAEKMWKKQDEIWDREDRARRRLMEEVSQSWNKQIQEKAESAKVAEEQALIEKNQVEARIQELKNFIQHEQTKNIQKRQELVKGLDEGVRLAEDARRQVKFQEESEDNKRTAQEMQEEVRLARYLNEAVQVSHDDQPPAQQDFRRRKVRWFY